MQHKSVITSAFFLGGTVVLFACQAQVTTTPNKAAQADSADAIAAVGDTAQLSAYIVAAFEDSKGNLWFGTVGDGVIRYSPRPSVILGERLTYFTTEDGLADMVSSSIVEDKQGHIWIGSHDGATRYDGTTFTAFKTEQGLHGPGCVLLVDRNGTLWAGTNDGAFQYDGKQFQPFDIPIPSIKEPSHKWVKGKVWEIIEDSKGNIWFGRDGYGATKFDGKTFTHFTKKDGLCSNNVASIAEDAQGNIWFGSITSDFPRYINEGGLSRYDGKTFTRFSELKGLGASDVYFVAVDRAGMVWAGAIRVGAYRFDGGSFTLFDQTDGPVLPVPFGIQSFVQDRHGTRWFGFSGGLYRFNGTSFVNVTRSGPWSSP